MGGGSWLGRTTLLVLATWSESALAGVGEDVNKLAGVTSTPGRGTEVLGGGSRSYCHMAAASLKEETKTVAVAILVPVHTGGMVL